MQREIQVENGHVMANMQSLHLTPCKTNPNTEMSFSCTCAQANVQLTSAEDF